jgi:hypothetical protein
MMAVRAEKCSVKVAGIYISRGIKLSLIKYDVMSV